MDVDLPGDGRIGVSSWAAHAADGGRGSAGVPRARAVFKREFRAVSCECAGQLLFDGGDQLHDRNVRDSVEIDSGFDSREILADRNADRLVSTDFIFSGCGAESHGATVVRVQRLRAAADLPWQARPG